MGQLEMDTTETNGARYRAARNKTFGHKTSRRSSGERLRDHARLLVLEASSILQQLRIRTFARTRWKVDYFSRTRQALNARGTRALILLERDAYDNSDDGRIELASNHQGGARDRVTFPPMICEKFCDRTFCYAPHDIRAPVCFRRVPFQVAPWRRDTAGASREIVGQTNRSPGYRAAQVNRSAREQHNGCPARFYAKAEGCGFRVHLL